MKLLLGDCVEEMRKLAPDSVDAIVTDPPYNLTNRVPDVKKCRDCGRVLGGADGKPDACPRCGGELYNQRSQGKGFMGKDWDGTGIAFDPETWREALRVLKPGGHLLAFGGTRTSHRMICAIEDAGFEIRDTITWIYASGFPKSHNISKAIDKMAGAEREVIGSYRVTGNALTPTSEKGDTYGVGVPNSPGGDIAITAPATPEAKQWDGWGTALKPASEPIVVARKPLSEKTIAANVLKHGTGAINIDGCRIATTDSLNGGAYAKNGSERTDEWGAHNGFRRNQGLEYEQPTGRWPANVAFSHHPDCVQVGVTNDPGYTINRFTDGAKPFGDGAGHPYESTEVPGGSQPVYACVPGCPVRMLDGQAGVGKGSVSRFFYVAKASKKERNAGLEGLPEKRSEYRPNDPDENSIRTRLHGSRAAQNHHPTVKPITLMRYLVRLVTPPSGTVLDPFMGSGTTGLACVDEGFDFIGIEMNEEYMEIARQRLASRE